VCVRRHYQASSIKQDRRPCTVPYSRLVYGDTGSIMRCDAVRYGSIWILAADFKRRSPSCSKTSYKFRLYLDSRFLELQIPMNDVTFFHIQSLVNVRRQHLTFCFFSLSCELLRRFAVGFHAEERYKAKTCLYRTINPNKKQKRHHPSSSCI
jgi:hypothetical protein